MIDYEAETITIFDEKLDREVTEKIERWVIWFSTAEETFPTLAEAKGNGPIVAVPVAIGRTIFEVVV